MKNRQAFKPGDFFLLKDAQLTVRKLLRCSIAIIRILKGGSKESVGVMRRFGHKQRVFIS